MTRKKVTKWLNGLSKFDLMWLCKGVLLVLKTVSF